jgi:hypothetical protein
MSTHSSQNVLCVGKKSEDLRNLQETCHLDKKWEKEQN